MKNNKIDVSFYEKNDLSGMMIKNRDKKNVFKNETKKITMNITLKAYEDAHELDNFMGMGYQNVLKTAIVLGLKDLHKLVERDQHLKKN